MNKEQIKQAKRIIADIIQDKVNIAEGNYGWAGQEYILTDIDKATDTIVDKLIEEKLIYED